MRIGKTIRIIRGIRDYSQEYLAQRLNISQKTMSRIENETTKIDFNRLAQIAAILDVDVITLLRFDEVVGNDGLSDTLSYDGGQPIKLNANNYDVRIKELEEQISVLRNLLSEEKYEDGGFGFL